MPHLSAEKLEQIFNELPQTLHEPIAHSQQRHPLSYFNFHTINEMCERSNFSRAELGLALLPLAASFSVTPVSDFSVGAVAFDADGNAYLGANFEFAGVHIGQTIHAEQSAIAHAWSRGTGELALLVINYAPCGHCRQFINEVNLTPDFQILLPESTPQPLDYYLPDAFGPADLGMSARILGGKTQSAPHADKLIELAQTCCINSHAPYSGNRSGVALQYTDGDIATGSYGENAAFNPSLPPLQMALNYRRLQGKNWRDITRAVMVETATTLSQKDNTQMLLHTIAPTVALTYQTTADESA